MEEVLGIPGAVPLLTPYPPNSVRASISAGEWQACVDSWLSSVEFRLRLRDEHFAKFKLSQSVSGVPFLLSLMEAHNDEKGMATESTQERLLQKRAYLLLRRLLLGTEFPFDLEPQPLFNLLSLASVAYASVGDWKSTLKRLWTRNGSQFSAAVDFWKVLTCQHSSAGPLPSSWHSSLQQATALVKSSSDVGLVLMTGSDYLETLMAAYDAVQNQRDATTYQRALTEHLFYCFRSLMSDGTQHTPLLLDHLYHMKSEADLSQRKLPRQPTLCSSLVCTTSFLRHLASDSSVVSGKRGQGLLDALNTLRQQSLHLYPPPVLAKHRSKIRGKRRADSNQEMHIHNASQVSQIHDLFPDLHHAYILKLLDHFNDDVEAVTAALLEPESLPPELRDQRTDIASTSDMDGFVHDLAPRSTPPLVPGRKNVFDGDDFDNLRISPGRLHQGRKDISTDEPETVDEQARKKAAIMAALAAFDSDDDERDDTYDMADVGGTVDHTLDTDSRPQRARPADQNPAEEVLFSAWRDHPDVFARDSKTRISKIRQEMKRETGMSDEQIEGWAVMLKKDPNLQSRLERKYVAAQTFRGNQPSLVQTRWRAEASGTDEEGDGKQPASDRRRGDAQVRGGAGSRGRGRGGSTAGPSSDPSTQAARKRKEQGRGRGGANHNRREGRARKMGRGMAGPT